MAEQHLEIVTKSVQALGRVREQIHRVIVGQEDVVDLALLALLCEGHVLLEGVPGLGKTMIVRALGECLSQPALRHRIALNFDGQSEGLKVDALIGEVLEYLPADKNRPAALG